MAEIVLKQLRKTYGPLEVVKSIDLKVRSNEFLVLVGPSGCGKTTTLRMIAGLDSVTSGEIRIGDRVVTDLPPRDRDIAMVFQSYALFPHFSVFENMSFGMRLRKVPKNEIERRISDAAQILGLTDLLARRPGQLSGGQRQRVAMGRAMVRDAKVFLFDEPLSNLDAKLRIQMRAEIRKVHRRVKTTVVYVTHDQVEAMTLADRIVVMNGGRIEQIGTPNELYRRPLTQFVAGFIGAPSMNFVLCRLEEQDGMLIAALADGPRLPVPESRRASYTPFVGRRMTFGIRPEHVTERRAHVGAGQTDFDAVVETVEPTGNDTMIYLSFGGAELCARSMPHAAVAAGETMSFSIDMNEMHLIDPETERVVSTIEPEADV